MNKGKKMSPPDFETYYIAILIMTVVVPEVKTHRLVGLNRKIAYTSPAEFRQRCKSSSV